MIIAWVAPAVVAAGAFFRLDVAQPLSLSAMGLRPTEVHEDPPDRSRAVGTMGVGVEIGYSPHAGWVFDPAAVGFWCQRRSREGPAVAPRDALWSTLRKRHASLCGRSGPRNAHRMEAHTSGRMPNPMKTGV